MTKKREKSRPEELKLELRRRRIYYGAPLTYKALRNLVVDVIDRVTTESESNLLKIDGRSIFRVGGGIFDIAIKAGNYIVLFMLEDDGQVSYVVTISRLGRYHPNLIRFETDIRDMKLVTRLIDELQRDGNFRFAPEVVEV